MKAAKPLKTDTRIPVAISYTRFSTPEQGKGDSRRRQTEGTKAWCEKNKIPLDSKLSFMDAGKSAFHGKHLTDDAALGQFLEVVKEGKVPRGSYLVIENLDRLSREDERTALRLWLDILDHGINIVQLNPETIFKHEKSDMVDIMRAVIELSRGHSESRMKSVRTAGNWKKAIDLAREGKAQTPRRKDGRVSTSITSRLPGWVEEKDGRLCLIPKRAMVVRRIFEMSAAGYGAGIIVKKLKKEKVPAFGNRVMTEEGATRKAEGDRYGCGEWRTAYVRSILSDRRALGEYQPRDANERKKGDPIPNYYPPAITEQEFYAARAGAASRRNKPGRIGEGVANLFGGLLKNARDGSTYYVATNGVKVLLNQSAVEMQSTAFTFPYEIFERAILSQLRELNPDEIASPAPVTQVSVFESELSWLRGRKAELALELMKGDVAVIADALRKLEAREAELRSEIDKNSEMVAVPRSNSWAEMKTLVDLLDNTPADELEDMRLRLRAAMRRIITEIWVLVVPRGRDRLCAVQVFFTDGGAREYIIFNRRPQANAASRDPGRWACRSLRSDDAGQAKLKAFHEGRVIYGPFDLMDMRNADLEGMVREWLEGFPRPTIDGYLKESNNQY